MDCPYTLSAAASDPTLYIPLHSIFTHVSTYLSKYIRRRLTSRRSHRPFVRPAAASSQSSPPSTTSVTVLCTPTAFVPIKSARQQCSGCRLICLQAGSEATQSCGRMAAASLKLRAAHIAAAAAVCNYTKRWRRLLTFVPSSFG